MAHEIPLHFRAALNPRELPAVRVQRLWALHAELSTAVGLAQAAAWLPPAWPHLLQLLADPALEVRAAAVPLLGHLGAMLAGGREPRLAGRLPPSALLDWTLALLSPAGAAANTPAAQRLTPEIKESMLSALHACVAALPPAALGPFAQPLLQLASGLLEASSTPPRLLGPLLRLLLAALPAVPLAALGQGFGDLVDLLCGWALEPLVAHEDRNLITVVLHALRPQWHSHPDFTASLTDNMLNDARTAAAAATGSGNPSPSTTAAAAASDSGRSEAAKQAASCMQLLRLLCDIFSAASLRQLPLVTQPPRPTSGAVEEHNGAHWPQRPRGSQPQQPQLAPALQAPPQMGQRGGVLPAGAVYPAVVPAPTVAAYPHTLQHPHSHHYTHQLPQQPPMQYPLQHPHQLLHPQSPPPLPPHLRTAASPLHLPHGAPAAMHVGSLAGVMAERPVAATAAPWALVAMLPTRPSAATVRHLIDLFPRILATLREVRQILVRLGKEVFGVSGRGSAAEHTASPAAAAAGESWSGQVCSCVELLVDSLVTCVVDMDPRDVDEVWERVGTEVTERLATLTLRDEVVALPAERSSSSGRAGTGPTPAPAVSAPPTVSAVMPAPERVVEEVAAYGIVGSAAVAVLPEALAAFQSAAICGAAEQASGGGGVADAAARGSQKPPLVALEESGVAAAPGCGESIRVWVLQTAIEWFLSLLSSGGGCASPAAAMEVMPYCLRLLRRAVDYDPRVARRLLLAVVLDGKGESNVVSLRTSPRAPLVATAGKLLHALLADCHTTMSAATLDWLLADLRAQLSAQGAAEPAAPQDWAHGARLERPRKPKGAAAGAVAGSAAHASASAAAFDCAVLQAACQRGLLAPREVLLVESTAWRAMLELAAPHNPSRSPFPALCPSSGSDAGRQPAAGAPSPPAAAATSPVEDALGPSIAVQAGTLAASLPTAVMDVTALQASPPASALSALVGPRAMTQLPASVASALCDAWAAAALAIIAAVGRGDSAAAPPAAPAALAASQAAPPVRDQQSAAANSARPADSSPVMAAGIEREHSAVTATVTAYLAALQTLQTGASSAAVQLRVIAALRRLLAHPTAGTFGVIRCERVFAVPLGLLTEGIASNDAGVCAAALDCAAALVAHVLQDHPPASNAAAPIAAGISTPAPPPRTLPPPPRPERLAPLMSLALDALTDTSAEVSASAARLAAVLSEPALLTALSCGPASYCTWVPEWQDQLAVAPQLRLPRPQHVARLLELVFQSAAAAQGSVLLRKRVPAAGAAGAGAGAGEEGELSGRLEALQRLALGMAPVTLEAAEGSGEVVGGDGKSAEAAVSRSGSALVWLALQEGARQLVSGRLRTHLGGPTQTLGALERMLQVTYSRLSQERREAGPAGVAAASRESAWLALEFAGALERAVAHAAEGHAGRDVLPQPVLAFFAANRKVCEEWFTRVRELLARIASLASAHHAAMHHGLTRLRDLRGTMRQLLRSLTHERKAAAAAAAATAVQQGPEGKAAGGGSGGSDGAQTTPPAASAATSAPATGGRTGNKQVQLQRKGGAAGGSGAAQQQQRGSAPAAAAAAAAAASTSGTGPTVPGSPAPSVAEGVAAAAADAAAPTAVQQLESSLSRLALAVVELLKLVGGAMLAAGEPDSLQGLHSWAMREFEPLLLGAHLPGASVVAAAEAAAAADALTSAAGTGTSVGVGLGGASPRTSGTAGGSRRRPETTRATRSGSKQQEKDAFAWLLGMSLQASGSYEQALLSYNAFLAPQSAPAGSAGGGGGQAALVVAAELAAAAQAFVVERVGECYAALSDWSGLQGLIGAFSRTATAEPAVAGWWPGTAAAFEHRFRALAEYDTGSVTAAVPEAVPGDPTSFLLAGLHALSRSSSEAGPAPRAAAATTAQLPQATQRRPQDLLHQPLRDTTSQELSRLMERLRATALAEPTSQRELLLQSCCLRGVARALEGAAAGTPAAAVAAEGPWGGLLLPHAAAQGDASVLRSWGGHGLGFGLGRALLAPDGTLQAGSLRDVAVTGALLRVARAADPRVTLSSTRAISVEHIRAAAAAGNWGLAARLVQAAAASASASVSGAEGHSVGAAAIGGGARAVLSVAHSLISASAGRMLPSQVIELQFRALLPHLTSSQPPQPNFAVSSADADDLACALGTLARWMLRAGAAHHHNHHHHPHQQQQQRQPHPDPARGPVGPTGNQHAVTLEGAAGGVAAAGSGSARAQLMPPPGFPGLSNAAAHAQWLAAADWPVLSRALLAQLSAQHGQGHTPALPTGTAGPSAAAPVPVFRAFAVPEALLQAYHAPAACCLRALQLSTASARAWRAWGELLFRVTKEHRSKAAAVARPPLQPAAPATAAPVGGGGGAGEGDSSAALAVAGYGAAAVAYCRYLSLSYSQDAVAHPEELLPVLLQLLHVVVRHAGPIEQLLATQMAAVPPLAWSAVTPQLLAQLPGATGASRRLLAALLHAVGRAAPSLVLYPAVVEVRAADAVAAATPSASGGDVESGVSASGVPSSTAGSMVPELRALLAGLGRSRPGLLAGVEVLVAEMERLTVLWDERWAALLTEVEVEIARRAVSLQAEAARVADDASLSPEQRQSLLASRYNTLMAPAVLLLERQLRATAAQPPETPHERRFVVTMLPRLRAAAAALRDGTGVTDWARPQAAWAPLRAVAAALARQQRQPLPRMAELSPRLAALVDTEVPMPGCNEVAGSLTSYQSPQPQSAGDIKAAASGSSTGAPSAPASAPALATVTVAGVRGEVAALSTKTRPKRMALLGSDGRVYDYLLKGREDLRMDERLMQVLRAMQAMLQADPAAAARGLLATVRHYSVTPLGPRAGLIQWVPATTSLFSVFRDWQAASLERHAAMVAARQEGAAKAAAEGGPLPPEVEPPPAAAVSRPMDLFYATLVPALQERGLSSATPRREWPADLLRAVFTSLAASAPRHLLERVLWAGGGSAALSWRRQQRYSRSLGVMSCVGHLLGLGDRHPDNILLEGRDAVVVHIDYNVCWDKGGKLRVPEVVPFRLTQMLSTALGVGGLEGAYRAAYEATLACLRRRREALVGLVDAVLSDPGVDWAVEREDMAARQDMELAVALNLFVSRAEEAQRHLQRVEEELAAALEGPGGALLAYLEAHTFAEAMRGAAAEAQQRIQQAKASLETANRVEAEARAIVSAAAQEAASLAAEAETLSAAVPQLLQQCGAWAQQHTATLGVLREGSFLEGTLTSGTSWRANESGCPLGLLAPVAVPGPVPLNAGTPLAVLPAVLGGDGLALSRLPEELLSTCRDCDCRAADLLSRREAALSDALSALTQYGTIVRKLLPPSYPAASYHHCWAQALSAFAAGGLSLPAVAQAQALAPREPNPADVAAAWQALRGSHRLATAAALVLAPGCPDAVAAMAGHVAGARVSGRELAGAVAAAARALSEAHGAAGVEVAATAAPGGEVLVRNLAQLLVRHRYGQLEAQNRAESRQQPKIVWSAKAADDAAAAAAAAGVLCQVVRSVQSRLKKVKVSCIAHSTLDALSPESGGPASVDSAVVAAYSRVGGEVAGLAAAAAAIADAGLSEAVFGSAARAPSLRHNGGGSSSALQTLTAAESRMWPSAGLMSGAAGRGGAPPLPWLAAAAEACGRWPELQHRLLADVAPELAGQLHVSGGGGSGAGGGSGGALAANGLPVEHPLSQAAVDLHGLLHPIEEALHAGKDCHTRLEALAELTATYHERAADLSYRLGGAAGGGGEPPPPLQPHEHASLQAELQALNAAWASRESVAAGLTAAAGRAAGALAEALGRLYAVVLGPARLPLALQTHEGAAAALAAAAETARMSGDGGWAESGGGGHTAAAALLAWWDAATEAHERLWRSEDGDVPRTGSNSAFAVSGHELPPVMRALWRCVEAARLVARSLGACQAARLAAPPGTDGSLAEVYSTVVQQLARLAAEYAVARLVPHLEHHLTALAAQLAAASGPPEEQQQQEEEEAGEEELLGCRQGDLEVGSAGAAEGGTSAASEPKLVPFTDFDPGMAGQGELLGGLEDEDSADAGGAASGGWDDYGGEGMGGGLGDGGDDDGDGGSGGYDLDLGLDLDLDDGFGGAGDLDSGDNAQEDGAEVDMEEETLAGHSWQVSRAGSGELALGKVPGGLETSAGAPPVSVEEVLPLMERLVAVAAAAAISATSASLDPTRPGGPSWAAGPEARVTRAARLQRLAAYEWLHEHHLLQALPAGDPRVGQALTQFFAAQAADPLQPSSRVTASSRLALLTQLQTALDALPQLQQAVSMWEAGSGGAVGQVMALLQGVPEQFPVDPALAAQRAGVLMGRRQHWLAESCAVAMRVCQVSEALLQFEYSRQGITWGSDGAAVADGFASHSQLLGRAEVLATLAAGGSEAGRAAAVAEASQRASEAVRQAADARYALEVAQYEEVAASSQLQAHQSLLVSRALDLPPAVTELEPCARALRQLLASKLGPALKELTSVSAHHSAASDVASVAAAVTSHFERSRQAVEALTEALPATAAALSAVDVAAPLPAEMATEVGFLSAQLLGGEEAANTVRERALALLQHMAGPTAALQPVVHVITELPRAVAQLSAELNTLAAAAGSIAAAVESKHLLPPVDDPSQQQQPQQPSGANTPLLAASGASATDLQATEGASAGVTAGAGAESESATGAATMPSSASASATRAPSPAPNASAAAAPAAVMPPAPDHLQHHRSRRSAADEARRRAFAAGALRRFITKLEGREGEGAGTGAQAAGAPAAPLSVTEQVDLLVRQATSVDRLSQMYEGWTAWL